MGARGQQGGGWPTPSCPASTRTPHPRPRRDGPRQADVRSSGRPSRDATSGGRRGRRSGGDELVAEEGGEITVEGGKVDEVDILFLTIESAVLDRVGEVQIVLVADDRAE